MRPLMELKNNKKDFKDFHPWHSNYYLTMLGDKAKPVFPIDEVVEILELALDIQEDFHTSSCDIVDFPDDPNQEIWQNKRATSLEKLTELRNIIELWKKV